MPANTGVYVYGILPGDVQLEAEADGVGDPPGRVRLVRRQDLAALVSDVDVSKPLGQPEDLTAHKELLDACANDAPVLPLRFGAVLSDDEAVADELIGENYDAFSTALEELDGRGEYVVKGRYDEGALLSQILRENGDAARLREQISSTADQDATRDARIQLGELISQAVEVMREQDTRALGDALDGHVAQSMVRQPTHEMDAVHVAFLVDADAADGMRKAVSKLAENWKGRVDIRLLGPMAAYDFVGAA